MTGDDDFVYAYAPQTFSYSVQPRRHKFMLCGDCLSTSYILNEQDLFTGGDEQAKVALEECQEG